MSQKVFVYDPTASDKLSQVRGIGRYLQILKENFSDEFKFVSDLGSVKTDPYNIFINPFFNFLQPPLTFKRLAQKQIAVIHDLIPLKYSSHFPAGIKGTIYILLNKLALKNYDLIITDSQASKQDIIDILKIKSEKLRVVYPCLPKSFLNPSGVISSPMLRRTRNLVPIKSGRKLRSLRSLDSSVVQPLAGFLRNDIGERFCLYVGDATWNKNLVNLARAIKIANVMCIFVGAIFKSPEIRANQDSPLQNINHFWMAEFKQFLDEVKDDKRFVFAGFVPDSQLIKLYQQAIVNILPSRDEGFGFSYLEASSQGCPSVLSDVPVLREISDGNALFCDPQNPHDMADKIGEIYFNQTLRDELGKKAKKNSLFFSPKKFKNKFLKNVRVHTS